MHQKSENLEISSDLTPFSSSEEAWLWCCLCEQLKNIRAKNAQAHLKRPCESADIIIALKTLQKEGKISQNHTRILTQYGLKQVPPHRNFGDSIKACFLWEEAMHFLNILLKKKGIVG